MISDDLDKLVTQAILDLDSMGPDVAIRRAIEKGIERVLKEPVTSAMIRAAIECKERIYATELSLEAQYVEVFKAMASVLLEELKPDGHEDSTADLSAVHKLTRG